MPQKASATNSAGDAGRLHLPPRIPVSQLSISVPQAGSGELALGAHVRLIGLSQALLVRAGNCHELHRRPSYRPSGVCRPILTAWKAT